MNETLYDLEQKREAVEQDIQALYETLQKEINEQKKIVNKINTMFTILNSMSNSIWVALLYYQSF